MSVADYTNDPRVVLTLDAGGTNFAFSAMRAGERVGDPIVLPSHAHDLHASLRAMTEGFGRLRDAVGGQAAAISFAFPGPADYPSGVVFNVGNLPAYALGVAVGPFLEERFGLPTYLNNDGDLFALGESVAGLTPWVNQRLAEAGSSRRCRNLFAVTLGTGLGGGAVVDGRLVRGDNSSAAEIWRLPGESDATLLAEEGASIRAVRNAYAASAGLAADDAPTPAEIHRIARGEAAGDRSAAAAAFESLGHAVGGVIAGATCFFDSALVVLGGGLSGAADLFLPAVLATLRGDLRHADGSTLPRLGHEVFDLRTDRGVADFVGEADRCVTVPGGSTVVRCNPGPRLGIGVSRLGANHATAVGACAYALRRLDQDDDTSWVGP